MDYNENPEKTNFPDFFLVYRRWAKKKQLKDPCQLNIYHAIANWCGGKSVLDAGCGIGIGTYILSQDAIGVLGVDLNQENVDVARAFYESPTVKFEHMDLTAAPERPTATFDVVACIEVIEHIADYDKLLNSTKRFHEDKRRTIFFISSPNRNSTKLGQDHPVNEYHVREWTAGEFYAVLTKHFRFVTMYATNQPNIFDDNNLVDGSTIRTPLLAKCEGPIGLTGDQV